jgi:glyoxylase-like metal-dependent hydrolase (beta-lactamase superfamily II)
MISNEEQVGSLTIVTYVLGPVSTNSYLVADQDTNHAVVIDPAWDGEIVAAEASRREWQIVGIWLTHAHFDHFGGAAGVANSSATPLQVALHPGDMPIWQVQGGAALFGFPKFDPGPEPSIELSHGMQLKLGERSFEVRHTPGHSQGHVMFLAREEGVAFCGDLIFQSSVGRTDLPGGSGQTLLESIRNEILTLPDDTRLYTGHGPATTVGVERTMNPFVTGAIPL